MAQTTERRIGATWAVLLLAGASALAQQSPGSNDPKLIELRLRVDVATRPYQDAIIEWSAAAGVDPALVASIITVESRGNPNATSPSGAMGLMQLMPATCADFGVDDPYDPVSSIRGGSALLAKHLRRYAGDLRKVLAAYNAGPKHVDDGSWINYPETRKYVPLVLSYYVSLRPGGDGLAKSGTDVVPMPPTAAAPAAPLPPVPPIQFVDRMFEAVRQRQSEIGPGWIAENMSLHEAASEVLGAYLDGKCSGAKIVQRAAREVAKAGFRAKTLKAFVLETPDGDSFAAAWSAKAPEFEGLVGLAHGTNASGHVWIVILATQP